MTNGNRRGWGVSVTTRPLFTPGKDPVRIVQEAGWAPGPVWTSAENLAHIGIRSPNRPARSQSIYMYQFLLISGLDGGEWPTSGPSRSTPAKMPRYPLQRAYSNKSSVVKSPIRVYMWYKLYSHTQLSVY